MENGVACRDECWSAESLGNRVRENVIVIAARGREATVNSQTRSGSNRSRRSKRFISEFQSIVM
jgi:hypothetical protein